MKKLLIALGAVLALTACEPSPEYYAQKRVEQQQAAKKFQEKLPPECVFKDLGDYDRNGYRYPIFSIFCKGTTTSISYPVMHGKVRVEYTVVSNME